MGTQGQETMIGHKNRLYEGRVAIVTGASSGIGKSIAHSLAQDGASVVIVAPNENDLTATAKEITDKTGSQVIAVSGDISVEKDHERIVNMTLDKFKRLDLAVNNAGVAKFAKLQDMTDDVMDSVLNIHVKGNVYAFKHQLAAMKKCQSGGSIIMMSSVLGDYASKTTAEKGFAMYAASKAALNMLVKYAAVEAAEFGVRVNGVAPGTIKTHIAQPGTAPFAEMSEEEFHESCKDMHILKRGGKPEEVAALVGFLGCEKSDFITGSIIPVDGGFSLKA